MPLRAIPEIKYHGKEDGRIIRRLVEHLKYSGLKEVNMGYLRAGKIGQIVIMGWKSVATSLKTKIGLPY